MLMTSPAVQDPENILTVIHSIQLEADAWGYVEFSSAMSLIISLILGDMLPLMQQLRDALESFEDRAYGSLVDYMQYSADLVEMPYEFRATCEIIQPVPAPPSPVVQTKLQKTLIGVIDYNTIYRLDAGVHQIDIIVDMILYLLQAGCESMDIEVARPVVIYLANQLRSTPGFNRALGRCNPIHLCSMLTKNLASGPEYLTYPTLYSIWGSCVYCPQLAVFDEQTLTIVCASHVFPVSPCVIAVLKSDLLNAAANLSPISSKCPVETPYNQTSTALTMCKTMDPLLDMSTNQVAKHCWKDGG